MVQRYRQDRVKIVGMVCDVMLATQIWRFLPGPGPLGLHTLAVRHAREYACLDEPESLPAYTILVFRDESNLTCLTAGQCSPDQIDICR